MVGINIAHRVLNLSKHYSLTHSGHYFPVLHYQLVLNCRSLFVYQGQRNQNSQQGSHLQSTLYLWSKRNLSANAKQKHQKIKMQFICYFYNKTFEIKTTVCLLVGHETQGYFQVEIYIRKVEYPRRLTGIGIEGI